MRHEDVIANWILYLQAFTASRACESLVDFCPSGHAAWYSTALGFAEGKSDDSPQGFESFKDMLLDAMIGADGKPPE